MLSRYDRLILAEPGLVGYWPLNDTGTSALDLKFGNNGTYANSPTLGISPLVPSDPEQAVSFIGGPTPSLVKLGNPTALQLNGSSGTVEMWAQWRDFTRFASGDIPAIFSLGTNGGMILGYFAAATDWRYYVHSGGAFHNGTINPSTYFGDLRPHHLVEVYDGANLTLWVDGVAVSQVAATGTIDVDVGVQYAINSYDLSVNAGNGNGQDINAQKVAVYKSALSSSQIIQHYQAGLSAQVYPVVTPDSFVFPVVVAPAGGIVAGGGNLICNAAIAESAQLVAPSGTDALVSNSVLAEPQAQIVAPGSLISNSVLTDTAQIVAPAGADPLISNSLLVLAVIATAARYILSDAPGATYALSDTASTVYTLSDTASAVYTISDQPAEVN